MPGIQFKNPKRVFSQEGEYEAFNSRISNLEANVYKITYYEIVSGTSGTLTVPTGATINEGEFGLSGNAILSKVNSSNKPTYESPTDALGANVTASLDLGGNWVTSGVYTDSQVALIYSLDIDGLDYHNLDNFYIIESVRLEDKTGRLPTGGNPGDIIIKNSSTDYDVRWDVNFTSNLKHEVKAGVAINKGQAVYVSSANGTNMIVSLADNTAEATSSKTMGLVAQDMLLNDIGYVVTEGLLAGLNTNSATAGDPVWLGQNGDLLFGLANKPYAPKHMVFIGIVTRKNANNGEIFVKVQNGFELDELHNVDLHTTVPVNGDVLGFDGTLWVNKTVATWLGYTPVPQTRTITINGVTKDLTANQDWIIGSTTGVRTPYTFTATAGQTTFTTVGYTVGQIDVYYNGARLLPSEYTATDGSTIVFGTGLIAGDLVEVVIWNALEVAALNSFEYFNQNLKSYPSALNYTGNVLNSRVYTLPTGTITKTYNRTGTQLTSVVLSGDIPSTIATTKTFTYTGTNLTSVTYS